MLKEASLWLTTIITHLMKGRLSIPLDFRIYIKKEGFNEGDEKFEARTRWPGSLWQKQIQTASLFCTL